MKPFKSNIFSLIAMIAIVTQLLAACAPGSTPTQQPMPADSTEATPGINPLAFQQTVRKLWEDHITWTRVYLIAAIADLTEEDAAAQRLLQNQMDIGNAIKPFYGDEAGGQLTSLLNEHIMIAVDLVAAAKAGETAKFEDATQRWYENADLIAAFLNSANPDNWPLADMQSMMKTHLDLTLEEATARLNENWLADVAAYDKVHDEILEMADMISGGIVQQFPDKFAALPVSQQEIDLTLAMDKLWEDHVTWTRVYIIGTTRNLPDTDAAAQRLLQNQVDIGNAIKAFYSDEAGGQLTSLLNEHILIAVDLLAAAKAGETAKFEDATQRWYKNADLIAAFLNNANPDSWPLADMQSMMKTHLDLTLQEVTARQNEDWRADVAAYDQVHDEILEMAGMLTKGIVTQFPDKFK